MLFFSKTRFLLATISTCVFFITGVSFVVLADPPSEPVGLFLTWQQDPATTMVIDWHVVPSDEGVDTLFYKPVGAGAWREVSASSLSYPYSDRSIHRVHLVGLQPDREYSFRVGEFERVYKFRTMPERLTRPVIFAVGGDTDHEIGGRSYQMNKVVMQYDLDFITWGGDLAYADGGDPNRGGAARWYGWFDIIRNTLIYEDGRVVPIVVGIGNHELKRYVGGSNWYHFDENSGSPFEPTYEWRMANAPFFFQLFAFPGHPGYGVLDFGNYMSLIILDTNHANKIEGAQTEWLEKVLKERYERGVPHVFPNYHVPAFPSNRSPNDRTEKEVRETWVPLFEEYGVRVAFENHDHTYKRTHPIRNGEMSEDGIVYIGDGNWGRSPRSGRRKDEWYIKKFASVNNGVVVALDGDTQHYIMHSNDGEVIDSYINRR